MNLKEIVEENNLKVGDSVLCTWTGDTDLENGEHVIQESGGLFPRLIGVGGRYWVCGTCEFKLIEKKRHVHADLIIWWVECPSENIIQLKEDNEKWTDVNPSWYQAAKYRKKPTATELEIEMLFNSSAKVTTKYIDDLHCLAHKINELKGQQNNA